MQIAKEYVEWLMDEKSKINQVALEDLEIFENGMKLDIPQKVIGDFGFTGLSNVDFILSDYLDVKKDEQAAGEENANSTNNEDKA